MTQFRVSRASTQSLTLEDALGRHHLAHALHHVPPVGALLHGPHPVRGFAILSDASSRRLCRVIFEHVDCGRDGAMVNEVSHRKEAASAGLSAPSVHPGRDVEPADCANKVRRPSLVQARA